MLIDIIKLLNARGHMTLGELAAQFDVSADAVEPMLDQLVAKGRLRRLAPTVVVGCPGCGACAARRADAVVYASTDDDTGGNSTP
jgi:hypothetical protein